MESPLIGPSSCALAMSILSIYLYPVHVCIIVHHKTGTKADTNSFGNLGLGPIVTTAAGAQPPGLRQSNFPIKTIKCVMRFIFNFMFSNMKQIL